MWSREAIQKQLQSERFDYQKVPLPHGLATEGHDRSGTADLIFSSDVAGKSVLDVGCSLGFFCFEAERRGAAEVVGIDVHPESIRKAKILAEMKGSGAQFLLRNLETAGFDRRFDVVLCLNVLHHLHDPLGTLNRLIDITGDRLVLEIATLGWHDKKKVRLPAAVCAILARFPIIFVTPTGTRGSREIQRFYMAKPAVVNLLLKHRSVFARLEVKESPHKGRFVVIAHKRRINHLLIVGGPTSAGKKTLMRKLLSNELPGLAGKLGTSDASIWGPPLNANHLDEPDEPVRSHVMLHYDIMRPFFRSTRVYERDEAMDLISCAGKVTFVTVATPATRLAGQIETAEGHRKADSRKRRIRELYENPQAVGEVYRSWIEFSRGHSTDHWMAEAQADGSYRIFPADDVGSKWRP